MSDYTPPVDNNNTNYLDWNNASHTTRHTADKIDLTASKVQFIAEMLENALLGFDSIEKELIELSNAPHPPQSHTISSYAHRIDTHQKQVQNGLDKIKQLMSEIDRETNNIQNSRNSW